MLPKHGKITVSLRGQQLFVRPIEPGDSEALRGFFAAHASYASPPEFGLIGKVVGELVAVMAIDVSAPGNVRIDRLVVAPAYRRKRVGRGMLHEVEMLARKLERDWLVVDPAVEGREFLRKSGFIDRGTAMVRRVGA